MLLTIFYRYLRLLKIDTIMTVQIHPLAPRDIPDAVECIQTVFSDDPFFRYIFNQSTVRHYLSQIKSALEA